MNAIGKFLVGLGVLMGSMGFVANAKVPPPGPQPKGGPVHSVTPPPPPHSNQGMYPPSNMPPQPSHPGRRPANVRPTPPPPPPPPAPHQSVTVVNGQSVVSGIIGFALGAIVSSAMN